MSNLPEVSKIDELTALGSIAGIQNWVTNQIKDQGMDWISSNFFKAIVIGEDSQLNRIEGLLQKVLEQQELILKKIDAVLLELKIAILESETRGAITTIDIRTNALKDMTKVNLAEKRELKRELIEGILANNSDGTAHNLLTIHKVLMGTGIPGEDGEGLLKLFIEKLQEHWLNEKQYDPSNNTRGFKEDTYNYLYGFFIVQYLGLCQLANAKIEKGLVESLALDVERLSKNYKEQKAFVDSLLPEWLDDYPEKLFDENDRYEISQLFGTTGLPEKFKVLQTGVFWDENEHNHKTWGSYVGAQRYKNWKITPVDFKGGSDLFTLTMPDINRGISLSDRDDLEMLHFDTVTRKMLTFRIVMRPDPDPDPDKPFTSQQVMGLAVVNERFKRVKMSIVVKKENFKTPSKVLIQVWRASLGQMSESRFVTFKRHV